MCLRQSTRKFNSTIIDLILETVKLIQIKQKSQNLKKESVN